MEINDDLREMLNELGHAINESISLDACTITSSASATRVQLYMVLDAKVA